MIIPPKGQPARTEREYQITYGTCEKDAVTVQADERSYAERVRELRNAGYLVVVQERQIHTTEWRSK